MTPESLISIIVPVYNIEDYLPRCLGTIAAQSYGNLEIILVDDGSKDRSGSICDDFAAKDGRAKVIHQKNHGLSCARNVGKKSASGDFLIFVDGDDYLHQDAISILHEALDKNPDCDLAIMSFENTDRLDEDTTAQGDAPTVILDRNTLVKNMFRHERALTFIYVWNKLYRRELIRDLWNEDYPRTEDFDFVFRVYLNTHKAAWVQRPLYFYVNRPTSIVHCQETLPLYYQWKTALLADNLRSLPPESNGFSHLLCERIFEVLIQWIKFSWETSSREDIILKCRRIGGEWLGVFWKDRHIPLIRKIALTVNLYLPRLTRWAKGFFNDRLHWPSLAA